MEYLIIGAGAIGTYLGASLLDAGRKVSFLEKPERVEILKQQGLHLSTSNKTIHISRLDIFDSMAEAFNSPRQVVIFAMKSFDTPAVVDQIALYRNKFDNILCLQNGVENETVIEKAIGSDQVIAGSITSAVSRNDSGGVILEKERGIGIEECGEISKGIAADFKAANLHPKLYSNRADMKWSKMLSNLLGNASCAILDLPPAQIFADPELFHIEMAQIKEALAVMQINGWKAVNLPRTSIGLLCFAIQHLPEGMNRRVLQRPLGGGRGKKMPSLHIDLHSGKKESEVDFLNGAVSRFGMQCGIDTPVNDTLVHTLKKLVQNQEQIDYYRQNKSALLVEIKRMETRNE